MNSRSEERSFKPGNFTAFYNIFMMTVIIRGLFPRVLYDIVFQYCSRNNLGRKAQLWMETFFFPKAVIPSTYLFANRQLVGGGDSILTTLPAVICASQSNLSGNGLTLATAGISASFTVWSRDVYGNLRDFPTVRKRRFVI